MGHLSKPLLEGYTIKCYGSVSGDIQSTIYTEGTQNESRMPVIFLLASTLYRVLEAKNLTKVFESVELCKLLMCKIMTVNKMIIILPKWRSQVAKVSCVIDV